VLAKGVGIRLFADAGEHEMADPVELERTGWPDPG